MFLNQLRTTLARRLELGLVRQPDRAAAVNTFAQRERRYGVVVIAALRGLLLSRHGRWRTDRHILPAHSMAAQTVTPAETSRHAFSVASSGV